MGKRLKLIYNPNAGRRKLISQLDTVIQVFQEGGYDVCIHRTVSSEDIEKETAISSDVEVVVVAGGDGSVHRAVNGLMKLDARERPVLGILPVGTANDLAYALRLPKSIAEAGKVIAQGKVFEMDIGKLNNQYFVNVASAGLLSDVSTKVDVRVKNTLGQLAYYLKGLETLPSFKPFRVNFTHNGKDYTEDILLLLVVNGLSVGGIRQLMSRASLTDGKLDVLMVKQSGWPETLRILLNMLRGENIESSNRIIQFQTSDLKIYTDRSIESDLDGELGPHSPWEISIGPKISVLC